MKATFNIHSDLRTVDLSKPLDISIPLKDSEENPLAWYLDIPKIEPVSMDNWVGSVKEGASINFNNINFNPHAHGTHTECVGHISDTFYSINEALKSYFFFAEVISVVPETVGDDQIISGAHVKQLLDGKNPEAVIIRTLPNTKSKMTRNYSHTNWPYLHEDAASYLRELGVKHLLIDLPSVDKEKDEGKLLAHKAFWNYPQAPRTSATITEFIYVANEIKDGAYLLNLQIAPFHNDATPSKPVLFKLL